MCTMCTDQICAYHSRHIISLNNLLPIILKTDWFYFWSRVSPWTCNPSINCSSVIHEFPAPQVLESWGVHPTCNFSYMDSRIQTQGLCSHSRYCVSWAISQPGSLCLLSGSNLFSVSITLWHLLLACLLVFMFFLELNHFLLYCQPSLSFSSSKQSILKLLPCVLVYHLRCLYSNFHCGLLCSFHFLISRH